MDMGSAVDWTQVLVALIAGLPAILSAIFAYVVVVRTKTPSGDSIGKQVEQANHLTAANVNLTMQVHDAVKGTTPIPPPLKPQSEGKA